MPPRLSAYTNSSHLEANVTEEQTTFSKRIRRQVQHFVKRRFRLPVGEPRARVETPGEPPGLGAEADVSYPGDLASATALPSPTPLLPRSVQETRRRALTRRRPRRLCGAHRGVTGTMTALSDVSLALGLRCTTVAFIPKGSLKNDGVSLL